MGRPDAWQGSDRRNRLPREWHRIRGHILKRDDHTCQLQYDCCIILATEVDHIIPIDDHTDRNLQAACPPCHRRKSSSEGVGARDTIRQLRNRPTEPHPGTKGGG